MPNLRDLLLVGLTGNTQQEIQDRASLGESPLPVGEGGRDLDKAVHALASQEIAQRYGKQAAEVVGGAKELTQGAPLSSRAVTSLVPPLTTPETSRPTTPASTLRSGGGRNP